MGLLGLVLGLGLVWWDRRDDPEVLGRALALAERVAPSGAPCLTPDELAQFERDVGGLRERSVRKISEQLEPPLESYRTAKVKLLGYPMESEREAWERPMEILAARMMVLDPEDTFSEAFWRKVWTDRFASNYIESYTKRFPDIVLGKIPNLYDEAWRRYDPLLVEGQLNWVSPIFRVLDQLEGKPGRDFLVDKSYQSRPYSGWLQEKGQLGLLSAAVESGEIEGFLDWKLDEGSELVDDWTGHSFPVQSLSGSGIPGLALSLLAKEDLDKAIRWASNHTLQFNFDWRAAIVSGWVEYYPTDREGIPKFETKRQDSLDWMLRSVEVRNAGLWNAFSRWKHDQVVEAVRWLGEPAVGPQAEEVKAALRADFLE